MRQQGGRLGLTWQPTSKLRVELNGLYQQVEADGLSEQALDPVTRRPLGGDLTNDNFVAEPFRKQITILAGRVNYDFGWANLTSISSYQYTNT